MTASTLQLSSGTPLWVPGTNFHFFAWIQCVHCIPLHWGAGHGFPVIAQDFRYFRCEWCDRSGRRFASVVAAHPLLSGPETSPEAGPAHSSAVAKPRLRRGAGLRGGARVPEHLHGRGRCGLCALPGRPQPWPAPCLMPYALCLMPYA